MVIAHGRAPPTLPSSPKHTLPLRYLRAKDMRSSDRWNHHEHHEIKENDVFSRRQLLNSEPPGTYYFRGPIERFDDIST